jgi:hypothetical protein
MLVDMVDRIGASHMVLKRVFLQVKLGFESLKLRVNASVTNFITRRSNNCFSLSCSQGTDRMARDKDLRYLVTGTNLL